MNAAARPRSVWRASIGRAPADGRPTRSHAVESTPATAKIAVSQAVAEPAIRDNHRPTARATTESVPATTSTRSNAFVMSGAGNPAYFSQSGTLLKALDDWAGLAGVFAFYVGGLLYYRIFYQARLVPRWLSAWGVGGVVLCAAAALLILFGATETMSTTQIVLNVPIGLQEMVLAVWLIVKGFNRSAIISDSGVYTEASAETAAV